MIDVDVERKPLSELLALDQELEPVRPFDAWRAMTEAELREAPLGPGVGLGMVAVTVTSLMERTAAYHAAGDRYDTGVIRLDRVFVDGDALEWKAKDPHAMDGMTNKGGRLFRRHRRDTGKTPGQIRADSDQRALADQARKHQEEIKTMAVQRISLTERQELAAKGLKRCPSCKKDLPIADINQAGYCAPCVRAKSAASYAKKHPGKATVPQRIPIKRSIAGKKARQGAISKITPVDHALQELEGALLRLSIPAESASNGQSVIVLPAAETIVPSGKLSPVLATSPAGDHYRTMAIEPIVYIEANALPFHEANVVKYVSRWRLKNGVEDLRKARFYIDRLIELEEAKVG